MTVTFHKTSTTAPQTDVVGALRDKAQTAISAAEDAMAAQKKAEDLWNQYQKAKSALEDLGIPLPEDLPSEFVTPTMTSGSRKKPDNGPTWKSCIMEIVTAQGMIPYADLKEALLEGPIGPRLRKSDKGFYNSLSRLESDKKLVRHAAHAFLPEVFKNYKSEVEQNLRQPVQPSAPGVAANSHIQNAIIDALKKSDVGLSGPEIVSALQPCNEKSVYNALSRLSQQNRIKKDLFEKSYYLPKAQSGGVASGEINGTHMTTT